MANDYSTITKQVSFDGGYVDASIILVDNISDVITLENDFINKTVSVKNIINGKSYPIELWLIDGTARTDWQVKNSSIFPSLEYLNEVFYNAIYDLSASKRGICTYSKLLRVGDEFIVQTDESSDDVETYYVKSLTPNGRHLEIEWAKKTHKSLISGDDVEEFQK